MFGFRSLGAAGGEVEEVGGGAGGKVEGVGEAAGGEMEEEYTMWRGRGERGGCRRWKPPPLLRRPPVL